MHEFTTITATILKKNKAMMQELVLKQEILLHNRIHRGYCCDPRLAKIQIRRRGSFPTLCRILCQFHLQGSCMDMPLLVQLPNTIDILHSNRFKKQEAPSRKRFRIKGRVAESFIRYLHRQKMVIVDQVLLVKWLLRRC